MPIFRQKTGGFNCASTQNYYAVSHQAMDPWGVELRAGYFTGTNDVMYTQKTLDQSTGLYDFGYRFYDRDTAQFLGQDLVPPQYETPLTLNTFQFCLNNPNVYVDPDGREVVIPKNAVAGKNHPARPILVDDTIVTQLETALNQLEAMDIKVTFSESFRTKEEQQVMRDRYLAGGPFAAKPEKGPHEAGLAFDLNVSQLKPSAYKSLVNVMANNGFMPVPKEKWHFQSKSALDMSFRFDKIEENSKDFSFKEKFNFNLNWSPAKFEFKVPDLITPFSNVKLF